MQAAAKAAKEAKKAAYKAGLIKGDGNDDKKGGKVKEKGDSKAVADAEKPAQQTKMSKEEKEAKKKAEKAAKDAVKKEKACIKEGGKKGQDVEGMAAMGTKWANVNLIEPQGSMEHLRMAFKAMIKEVDPEGEDRKGGAFPFGKMLFSAGDASLAAIIHVPAVIKRVFFSGLFVK